MNGGLKKILPIVFLIASAGQLGAQTPEEILKNALESSGVIYRGRMISVTHSGEKTRVSEAVLSSGPNQTFRKEFLAPNGTVERLVVSDGETEWIYIPARRVVWQGNAKKTDSKALTPEEEWALLTKNYKVALAGEGRAAGQEIWTISLSPQGGGKTRRSLGIAKKAPVILTTREYNPDGTIAAQSDFTDIEFPSRLDPALFEFKAPQNTQVKDHGLEPEFLSWKEMKESGLKLGTIPASLPQGFVFESGDVLTVANKDVAHLRFTDGLIVLSLFESQDPFGRARAPWNDEPEKDGNTRTGHTIRWKSHNSYYILMGELPAPVLQTMAHSLK